MAKGSKEDPWVLKTPPGTSEYQMYRDESTDPPALVCQVGSTQLRYDLRAIEELHAMLKQHGDWMDLGTADEQKEAKEGTVEGWGRAADNPRGGWYGLKKGYRGRFGMYVPEPLCRFSAPQAQKIDTVIRRRCRFNWYRRLGAGERNPTAL